MRLHLFLFLSIVFTGFIKSQSANEYLYSLDLTKVNGDKIAVKLIPPAIKEEKAVFMFPAIIPGTYAVYNFGRFISNFTVTGKDGKAMPFSNENPDTYTINNPQNIDFITYLVEDTWDTQIKKDFVLNQAELIFRKIKITF